MRIFEKAVTAYAIAKETAQSKGEAFPFENEEQWIASLKGEKGEPASLEWSDIQNMPLEFPPSNHTHSGVSVTVEIPDSENMTIQEFAAAVSEALSDIVNNYAKISNLAQVAKTGSYNDLSGKPTIPTVPSSLPANGGNADTVDNYHFSVSSGAPTVNDNHIITFVV